MAYAKFMTKKIQQDFSEENKEEEVNKSDIKSKPSVKFRGIFSLMFTYIIFIQVYLGSIIDTSSICTDDKQNDMATGNSTESKNITEKSSTADTKINASTYIPK